MSREVWAVWPTVSIERSNAMVDKWHAFGYKVAVLINPPFNHNDLLCADRVVTQSKWYGFPMAVNILCRESLGDIIVVVGDDVYPDPHHSAEEIGDDFRKTFPDLDGVMQPTGDKFGSYDKCAVSPWIGRTFIQRAYNGKGPYREEYFHYFSDQELQEYAIQRRSFHQRDDLIQFHDHWQRKENPHRPEYLMEAKRLWSRDKNIFEERKKKGFPE